MKIDASFYSEALDEVKMIDIYLPPDYYGNPSRSMQPYIIYMVAAVTRMKELQMLCIIITCMLKIQQ